MTKGVMRFCCSAEENANELDRLRRLLCIPRADVDKVSKEICGRIYQDVSPLPPLTSDSAMAGRSGLQACMAVQQPFEGACLLCVRKMLRGVLSMFRLACSGR